MFLLRLDLILLRYLRRRNNGRRRRIRRRGTAARTIAFPVITTIEASAITMTTQNLEISFSELLVNNEIFQQWKNMYQYYKLKWVTLTFIPQPVQGTPPPIGWIYFLGNEDVNAKFSSLPDNPKSKRISNIRVRTFKYTRFGRQDDFNYWYKTNGITEWDAYARIRFKKAFSSQGPEYTIKLRWYLIFKSFIIKGSDDKIIEPKDKATTLISCEFPPNLAEDGKGVLVKQRVIKNKASNEEIEIDEEEEYEEEELEDMELDQTTSQISNRSAGIILDGI